VAELTSQMEALARPTSAPRSPSSSSSSDDVSMSPVSRIPDAPPMSPLSSLSSSSYVIVNGAPLSRSSIDDSSSAPMSPSSPEPGAVNAFASIPDAPPMDEYPAASIPDAPPMDSFDDLLSGVPCAPPLDIDDIFTSSAAPKTPMPQRRLFATPLAASAAAAKLKPVPVTAAPQPTFEMSKDVLKGVQLRKVAERTPLAPRSNNTNAVPDFRSVLRRNGTATVTAAPSVIKVTAAATPVRTFTLPVKATNVPVASSSMVASPRPTPSTNIMNKEICAPILITGPTPMMINDENAPPQCNTYNTHGTLMVHQTPVPVINKSNINNAFTTPNPTTFRTAVAPSTATTAITAAAAGGGGFTGRVYTRNLPGSEGLSLQDQIKVSAKIKLRKTTFERYYIVTFMHVHF
jgi:hypothetical protein